MQVYNYTYIELELYLNFYKRSAQNVLNTYTTIERKESTNVYILGGLCFLIEHIT